MEKTYNHKGVENRIYSMWEKAGYFTPKIEKDKNPFTIIMPPPNANDPLHIGHAMFVTIEDILTRYFRMKGVPTLWLPGSDHAGIETQYVFEKKLAKEGKSRFDFSREEFYQKVYDYVQSNTGTMINQLKSLGASCDWSRFKFTLDPDIVKIVYKTFYKLYEDKLVYRSERIINFCPRCGTAFSDLEAKDKLQKDPLYYLKYGPFVLATVRPETKFGDTAIAVHPKDKRYQKYIGQKITAEGLLGKFELEVIADNAVDPKFGTGVVKVTPAHDPDDFEMGQRHNLPILRVIDFNGRLNEKTGMYQGLKIKEAREKVVADLTEKGLIDKIDNNYTHNIKVCYRCSTTLEPMVLPQWFVKVDGLKKQAMNVVRKGEIKIIPKRFIKQYLNWMENLKDWNISRQIWWGIPIPVWYCTDCANIEKVGAVAYIPKDAPVILGNSEDKNCPKCAGTNLLQDPDTFDTWFSSGQWPYATLLANGQQDFNYFYPTTVMETAADILYMWVARMIMLGLYRTKKIPFSTVYLHAIVRDSQGQKISKSKGNVVDPNFVVEKYGADVLRLSLIWGVAQGGDAYVSEEKFIGMRNFCNKLWNIARFLKMNFDSFKEKNIDLTQSDLAKPLNKKMHREINSLITKVTKNLDNFKFATATELIYEFVWHKYADKYLESSKENLRNFDKNTLSELLSTFKISLTLLHPFIPYITEEINHLLFPDEKLMITSVWPKIL